MILGKYLHVAHRDIGNQLQSRGRRELQTETANQQRGYLGRPFVDQPQGQLRSSKMVTVATTTENVCTYAPSACAR